MFEFPPIVAAVLCLLVVGGLIYAVRNGSDLSEDDKARLDRWARQDAEEKARKRDCRRKGVRFEPRDFALEEQARAKIQEYEGKAREFAAEYRAKYPAE
jgi:hypothetical protein